MKNLSEYTLKEMMENLDAFCDGNEYDLKDFRIEVYPFMKTNLDSGTSETEAIPYSVTFYNLETGDEFDFSEFLRAFDQSVSKFIKK